MNNNDVHYYKMINEIYNTIIHNHWIEIFRLMLYHFIINWAFFFTFEYNSKYNINIIWKIKSSFASPVYCYLANYSNLIYIAIRIVYHLSRPFEILLYNGYIANENILIISTNHWRHGASCRKIHYFYR